MVSAATGLLSKVLKEAVGPGGAFNLTLLNIGAHNFKEAAKRGADGLAPALSRLLQGSHGPAQLPAGTAPGEQHWPDATRLECAALHPLHITSQVGLMTRPTWS